MELPFIALDNPLARDLLTLALTALGAWILARWPLTWLLPHLARRTATLWDDVLLEPKVLARLANFVPLAVLNHGLVLIEALPDETRDLGHRVLLALTVIAGVRLATALIAAALCVYERLPVARERPLKGLSQMAMLLCWGIGLIVVVATLMDRSPWYLISGLGAATAVLLLVFRDTILSLVAGLQLISNRLVRVGDWLEMPQFNADGTVIEIALNTVLVRNFDNTITVIPTHSFLSHSFRNWRGMQESGGRRIKRVLLLDQSTIRHLTADELDALGRIAHLRPWLSARRADIAEFNRSNAVDEAHPVNGRRLTNLGCFRAYALAYLRQHPLVRRDMTVMVRHLEPRHVGLPLEVYCFTTTTEWAVYEEIQSDIMDHLQASLRHFHLAQAQVPTVAAMQRLAGPAAPPPPLPPPDEDDN